MMGQAKSNCDGLSLGSGVLFLPERIHGRHKDAEMIIPEVILEDILVLGGPYAMLVLGGS